MLKQSPSRNQRSKRFKVMHILQICLLVAICIWLLYQVKRSYDKKAVLEVSSRQVSQKVQTAQEILKLGRKDLNPQLEEIAAEFRKHQDDDEELEQEDEASKLRENKGEGRGGGDDEIDGSGQEKEEEEEPEQLEDLIDEEDKETEEESEEEESVDNENYIEDVGALYNQDHISKKAQEDHYKGDDAASAVIQNTHILTVDNKNVVLRAVKEEGQVKNVDVREGGPANMTPSVNSVGSEEDVNKFSLNNLGDGSGSDSLKKAVLNELQGENIGIQRKTVISDGNGSGLHSLLLQKNQYPNETVEVDRLEFNGTLSVTGNSSVAKRGLRESSGVLESVGTEERLASTTSNENATTVCLGGSNTEKTEETPDLSTTNRNGYYGQNELN